MPRGPLSRDDLAAVNRLRRWYEEQPFGSSHGPRGGENPDAGTGGRMLGCPGWLLVPTMSLLKRWDTRNQRIAEWQLHGSGEKPRDEGWFAGIAVGVALLVAVFRRDLPGLIGSTWTLVLLGGFAAICFVGEFIGQRRKRLAWEEARRRGREKS